jgi:hypothetical protein
MNKSCVGAAILALVAAGVVMASSSPSQAFWQRSQVSMCADATSAQERARHRCDELNAYADPGWPTFGVGGAAYRAYPRLAPGPGDVPGARPPVRRLG